MDIPGHQFIFSEAQLAESLADDQDALNDAINEVAEIMDSIPEEEDEEQQQHFPSCACSQCLPQDGDNDNRTTTKCIVCNTPLQITNGQLNLDLIYKVLDCTVEDVANNFIVPVCESCHIVLAEAAEIYGKIQTLASKLRDLRNNIKKQIAESFVPNTCQGQDDDDLDAARRIILGEDCPGTKKAVKKRGQKRGRKKKTTTTINKAALYPRVTLERLKLYDACEIKEELTSDTENQLNQEVFANYQDSQKQEGEEEVTHTYFGRKVKKLDYKKILQAGEDEMDEYIIPENFGQGEGEEMYENAESPTSEEQEWIPPGHSDEDVDVFADESEESEFETEAVDNLDDLDIELSSTKKGKSNDEVSSEERSSKANLKLHYCELCDMSLRTNHLLKKHLEKIHDIKPPENDNAPARGRKKFSCKFCGQEYQNKRELENHIRNHTEETPYKCGVGTCTQSFSSAIKKLTHIEQKHPSAAPLKCDHCPKGFFRNCRLKKHRATHTGEKNYLCEICSQSFSQPTYLLYHQTSKHHEELQLGKYKCEECDRTFSSPVNLRLHTKTQHQREYRYYCKECNHGALHLSHLKIHMLTHNGEKPYACKYPKCDKAFTRASQLKIHTRSRHTNERPFVCKTCKKTFTTNSKLKRHEMTHLETKPYSCEFCGKCFTQTSNLNTHIKTTHSGPKASQQNSQKSLENQNPQIVQIVEIVNEDSAQFQHHQVYLPQENIQFQNFQMLTDGQDGVSYQGYIILDDNFRQ